MNCLKGKYTNTYFFAEVGAPPNAEKDVEPQELPFIAGRNAKWYSPFGNSVVLPYRTKSTLTI